MKEFLEKTLRQNVIMTENKEVYKKLPLAYRGRYDIFTVLLSEGDTTITLLCETVNIYCARVNSIALLDRNNRENKEIDKYNRKQFCHIGNIDTNGEVLG